MCCLGDSRSGPNGALTAPRCRYSLGLLPGRQHLGLERAPQGWGRRHGRRVLPGRQLFGRERATRGRAAATDREVLPGRQHLGLEPARRALRRRDRYEVLSRRHQIGRESGRIGHGAEPASGVRCRRARGCRAEPVGRPGAMRAATCPSPGGRSRAGPVPTVRFQAGEEATRARAAAAAPTRSARRAAASRPRSSVDRATAF
jgi:hypothetical protein